MCIKNFTTQTHSLLCCIQLLKLNTSIFHYFHFSCSINCIILAPKALFRTSFSLLLLLLFLFFLYYFLLSFESHFLWRFHPSWFHLFFSFLLFYLILLIHIPIFLYFILPFLIGTVEVYMCTLTYHIFLLFNFSSFFFLSTSSKLSLLVLFSIILSNSFIFISFASCALSVVLYSFFYFY